MNNNIIEELAFMDEKLDKILEQQEIIMKHLLRVTQGQYADNMNALLTESEV